jgi:circadian clock protein KaiB
VDIFLEPARALAEGIFVTPTLLKLSPAPALRIVGTLADSKALMQSLGLDELQA